MFVCNVIERKKTFLMSFPVYVIFMQGVLRSQLQSTNEENESKNR